MKPKPCRRAEILIHRYLDEELTPAELGELAEHLGACAGCREEFRSARKLEELVRQAPVPPPQVPAEPQPPAEQERRKKNGKNKDTPLSLKSV
ncbi:MAG: zf-HC2 domain-containing protein [Planctomycetota bacterium]|nr:zf-HC2 domain-containing protein [Planctomycetota bacterium]